MRGEPVQDPNDEDVDNLWWLEETRGQVERSQLLPSLVSPDFFQHLTISHPILCHVIILKTEKPIPSIRWWRYDVTGMKVKKEQVKDMHATHKAIKMERVPGARKTKNIIIPKCYSSACVRWGTVVASTPLIGHTLLPLPFISLLPLGKDSITRRVKGEKSWKTLSAANKRRLKGKTK